MWQEFSVHERRSRLKKRAGHYKDLTETRNRARKVSGTQRITSRMRTIEMTIIRFRFRAI